MYLNRRVKLLVSVMLSSYFFQLNVTTWFLQDTFFRYFKVFTKNNIVMSTRRRERYSAVSQILQLADLSSPRKEGLKHACILFDYHGDHHGDVWRV